MSYDTYLKIGYLLRDITSHNENQFTIHGNTYSPVEVEWVTGYEQYAKHYANKLGVGISQGAAFLLGNYIPVDEDSGADVLRAVCDLYSMIEWVLPKEIRGHIKYRGFSLFKGGKNQLNILADRGIFFLSPLDNGLARVEVRGVTKAACFGLCSKYLSYKGAELASMRKDLEF